MEDEPRVRAASGWSRNLVIAALFLSIATTAEAYNDQVTRTCTDDYLAYCKQHHPDSTETRYCMEAHRKELSKQCVQALIDAGEVPRKYLIRKVDDRL